MKGFERKIKAFTNLFRRKILVAILLVICFLFHGAHTLLSNELLGIHLNRLLKKPDPFKDMVFIAEGKFQFGMKNDKKNPLQIAETKDYWIDKYEVTFRQYFDFCGVLNCEIDKDKWGFDPKKIEDFLDHPAKGVTWLGAYKYCQSQNKRLPSEIEWEKAASWKEGRKYLYSSGKGYASCEFVVMNEAKKRDKAGCGKGTTWPVGSKPVEINGTFDMAGNVWEWVADPYIEYKKVPLIGVYKEDVKSRYPGRITHYTIRGGNYLSLDHYNLTSIARFWGTAKFGGGGFRCVKDP